MAALSIGVLLWVVVHLIPSIEQPLRQRLISRLGEKGYKGAFALTVLIALVLIVLGWRSTPETSVASTSRARKLAGSVYLTPPPGRRGPDCRWKARFSKSPTSTPTRLAS